MAERNATKSVNAPMAAQRAADPGTRSLPNLAALSAICAAVINGGAAGLGQTRLGRLILAAAPDAPPRHDSPEFARYWGARFSEWRESLAAEKERGERDQTKEDQIPGRPEYVPFERHPVPGLLNP